MQVRLSSLLVFVHVLTKSSTLWLMLFECPLQVSQTAPTVIDTTNGQQIDLSDPLIFSMHIHAHLSDPALPQDIPSFDIDALIAVVLVSIAPAGRPGSGVLIEHCIGGPIPYVLR